MTYSPEDHEELLDHVAYVLGSKYRRIVVEDLDEKPRMPTQIADQNGVQRSHISRALGELESKGIVKSNSGGARTKLYSLTSYGQKVTELAEDIGGGEDEA